jgi:hypothetical protein
MKLEMSILSALLMECISLLFGIQLSHFKRTIVKVYRSPNVFAPIFCVILNDHFI